MVGGELAVPSQWPHYAAAVVALVAAVASRGSMLITLGVGMVALHSLPSLLK